jgi:hypothetical protein
MDIKSRNIGTGMLALLVSGQASALSGLAPGKA